MSREQLVEQIRSLNPTVATDWLGRFEAGALRDYLDHLQHAQGPRGSGSVWARRGDTRAIVRWAPSNL